jgi:tRNA(Ile)-lysidine synthase
MMIATETGDADPEAASRALNRFLIEVVVPESFSRILIALSGGPDSVALLRATVEQARSRGIEVVACWVDHAIRPEHEIEEERVFVRALCDGLGIPLVIESARRGDIEAQASQCGGVEAAARDFRYKALERARASERCDIILTGHTADDVLETMVMRFFAGSGSSGLRGIPMRNGCIARPLLSVTKADGLAYLGARGQPYRVDSTNEGDDYLRNRVRHDLLPVLEAVFPACGTALMTVAGKMRIDDDALSADAESLLIRAEPDKGEGVGSWIDVRRFDEAPLAVRIRALYKLASSKGFARLPWRLVLAAATAKTMTGPLASGRGIEFVRNQSHIAARALPVEPAEGSGEHQVGFAVRIDGFGSYRIGKTAGCRVYSSNLAPGLRLDSFEWPLWIRSRRPGDAIMTAGGLKMIDALLSERRRNTGESGLAMIVEDRSGIVAVLHGASGTPGVAQGRAVFRRNDHLNDTGATEFLVFDLKGVVRNDAV